MPLTTPGVVVGAMRRRLQIIRLAIWLYRAYKQIQRLQSRGGDKAAIEGLYASAGRDIRETANRLCGAIVKAGQFLGLREELFPQSFTTELRQLQDNIPPAPFSDVRNTISEACEQPIERVFRQIDPIPIASGSIAQVHRAELMNGQVVAIKVLRPGIEHLVAVDLSTLHHVAHLAKRIPALRSRLDFVALHRTFATTLERELNMCAEAEHMERMRGTLGSDSRITIPQVFSAYTTTRVLVMDFVEGANIRDAAQLESEHINRYAVRDALLDAYLKQLLVTGFVHLDPHPGNLAVLSDGKLALLDFGMVAEYSAEERNAFRNLMQRLFFRDFNGVASILQDLGFLLPESDTGELVNSIRSAVQQFNGAVLRELLRLRGFRVEAKYMLLVRCLGMLKTALTILTPDETDWPGVLSEHALPALLNRMDASNARV
ncbi:AarF/ABC1/UbiB kinase family protein [Alicyclobacillus cycloheptanicus]|uniref:Unusual protein kinase regulating ubiquinone biosynthesis (AarF/ABC1/UbiB family) n=1 Tax=Alicyclobacillus cycloheptanicus TaxID=1457 RepID=A0ABT9XM15_9BACL|nr:AarF/ABC1/UbiB kinase family protein [Alicyclobacillus cycloheptanicus]MDQ0191074.1 putative unusual protein kinase regulating ubiquinone biosynthesis (AarF/ABC1/UbiB family) [Alicyclobacillus cycloheptanicus]WDM00867.1 AarF/ABC1/UbiB kinase family protein [Alicyclobacillus cycloheptanicus]